MAKDDYHVILYQILSYLYVQLKNGDDIDPRIINYDSPLVAVNKKYWSFIMTNAVNDGYISGVTLTKVFGSHVIVSDLDCAMITPKGIEYFTDNSFLRKAKAFLKETKAITPFI